MLRRFSLITRREYLQIIGRRSFLAVTLGFPFLLLTVMAVSILANVSGGDAPDVLGYVDQSGVLATQRDDPGFQPYLTVESAEAALEAGSLEGYYVIPPEYRTGAQVYLFYWDRQPAADLQSRFDSFLRANLVAGLDPAVAARVVEGPRDVIIRSLDGDRESDARGLVSIILPFGLGLFLSFALMSGTAYLLRAVAEEKENRTIEIMTTSVSPEQLMIGKSVGLVGVALTQVVLWVAIVAGGLGVAAVFVDFPDQLAISWTSVLILAAFFLPAFTLAAALVVVLGVAVADTRQGQQMSGLISMLFLLPLFFSPLLATSPDGTLMMMLTLFPTTSMLAVAVRWGVTVVPLWQLIAAWIILAVSAELGIWAAPRIFRRGMLRYGRRMTLRNVADALRSRG